MGKVSDFIWKIALKKGVTKAIQGAIGAYGTNLAGFGITIDQAALIGAIIGALETLRNYLKHKKGVKFL